MKKPAVIVRTNDPQIKPTLDAIKENIEILEGKRGSKIRKLESDAVLAGVIEKINEIIDRLQD